MKLECLLLAFVLFAFAVAKKEVYNGGWSPIKNINDFLVTVIANFPVTEYDKRSSDNIKLKKVIKGDTQEVSGINYHLILAPVDGSYPNNYEAIVLDNA
ncbi:Cysteine proteinase inhibitor 1 [Spatholobus suberectus]|nr:Cysteine proteinase inhibitor 1 [Spatholobus suberectus]